ncbi:ABC transporter permease [Streptomyces sp. NPDC056716]|uniref:ABC transporter permease n=1 Tax=unclassified Streptomyces TaxID=2593676 RepID=UPI00369955C9
MAIVTAPPDPQLAASQHRQKLQLTLIAYILPAATIGLMIYFSFTTSAFLTSGNLLAVATQNAPTFVVAVVAALLMMAGYIDLSVGSTMAVSGVAAGLMFNSAGILPGILVGLAAGLAVGLLNGYFIGFQNFSPIVVTLGLLAAGRGVALFLAPQSVFGFPQGVIAFGSDRVGGVSYLVMVAVVVTIVTMIVFNRLPVGKHIVAIGVNKRAAYLNGIHVKRITLGLYAATGVAAATAGLLQVARLNSAPSATLGSGFEVTILTAVLLAGIPAEGGRGAIWRVLVAAWLIAVLGNGLTLMNVGVEMSGIITGAVLVAAAGLEAVRRKIRSSS